MKTSITVSLSTDDHLPLIQYLGNKKNKSEVIRNALELWIQYETGAIEPAAMVERLNSIETNLRQLRQLVETLSVSRVESRVPEKDPQKMRSDIVKNFANAGV